METKKVPEISQDSLSSLFNKVPFALFSPRVGLTQKIIYEIYKGSNFFTKSLKKFSILKQNYDITFEEENDKEKKNREN